VLIAPDDEPRPLAPAPHLWEAFEVRRPERGGPGLTVLLVDPQRRIRFRREGDALLPAEQALLVALRSAAASVRGIGRRELIVNAIVLALGAALLEACETRPAPARPVWSTFRSSSTGRSGPCTSSRA
jgi:hypothetical protein